QMERRHQVDRRQDRLAVAAVKIAPTPTPAPAASCRSRRTPSTWRQRPRQGALIPPGNEVNLANECGVSTTFGRFFAGTGFPNHFFCDSWVVGFLEWPTMVRRTSDWRDELGRWLKPFLDRLGHKARRQCPLYVSGLIGPGDRKSVQPMAKRLALGACD